MLDKMNLLRRLLIQLKKSLIITKSFAATLKIFQHPVLSRVVCMIQQLYNSRFQRHSPHIYILRMVIRPTLTNHIKVLG